jgi:hypothetical protein
VFDRVLAVISIALLIGFMSVVVWYVGRTDLTVVVALVLVMAIYDFWREFRNQKKPKATGK